MEKKITIFLLFFTACGIVWGQDELSRNAVRNDSANDEVVASPEGPGHYTPVLKSQTSFTSENSYSLNPDQIPATLRSTLEAPEYAGWEEGTILRHLMTGEYRIEIVEETEKKVYMFSTYGERIANE